MSDRAREALRKMRSNAELAIHYVRQHPDWRDDQFATDAIAKRVELVAEAAGYRMPEEDRVDYPSIPWRRIIGMRHRLVHDYDGIDLDILAATLEEDLPRLIEEIKELLQ